MGVITRVAVLVSAVASLALVQPGTAQAAGLPNDNFASATSISALPFSDSGDLNGATVEPGEPGGCGVGGARTVWYAFTPAAKVALNGDLSGSDSGMGVNFYSSRGSDFSDLSLLGCAVSGENFHLTAQAGVTYYFQIGDTPGQTEQNFRFHLERVPAPANDDFANATQVTTLPFTDTLEHPIGATIEADEPNACLGGAQNGSVWWKFTPSAGGSYTAQEFFEESTTLAVYQGTSPADLTQVACGGGGFFSLVNFQATAGVTYYVRAFGPWDIAPDLPLSFKLQATPPPAAAFFFAPSEPSAFDSVQFFDESSDPAQVGIQSEAWDFGDGTSGTGSFPTHHYAADGDYTTKLTVTTTDGRTAAASQVVHILTHDVAITKFTTPASAKAGQTRSVAVGVSDKRYPETVQVQLLKGSSQGGFDQIGTLTQSIPPTKGTGTVPFSFNYTFTSSDTAVGKVTFEAVATIQGARDAFPADNTAIATTTVRQQTNFSSLHIR
jgi:PKD repeat protein